MRDSTLSTRRPSLKPAGAAAASVDVGGLTLALPHMPFAAQIAFVPLSVARVGVPTLITILYIGASALAKAMFYRSARQD
jgi:hypothetical protein